MLAVILAAGRGTRLRPLTDERSKPMLPVVGEPMIGRVMDYLVDEGADYFVLVVHPDDDALIGYLTHPKSKWRDVIRLAYQAQRLGMAHALACAAPVVEAIGADDFVLASCDNLYPQGHAAALFARRRRDGLDATLTLMSVRPEQIPTLAVVTLSDSLVTHIVEKPALKEAPSDLGVPALYALSTAVFDYLPRVPVSPRGELEFPEALRLWIEDGGRIGGLRTDWRMTMTCPSDLLALNQHFLQRSLEHPQARVGVNVSTLERCTIEPPVCIEPGVGLGTGCHIGPEVYLEAGACVGAEAVVRRAVVLRGARVVAAGVVEDVVMG